MGPQQQASLRKQYQGPIGPSDPGLVLFIYLLKMAPVSNEVGKLVYPFCVACSKGCQCVQSVETSPAFWSYVCK